MNLPNLTIAPQKQDSLLRKHPWVFRGAILKMDAEPQEGDWVNLITKSGQFLGLGHYQAAGSIAVRVISFEPNDLDQAFWDKKIEAAWSLRRDLGLTHKADSIFRLVHGEGDGCPGLIVDVYGQVAVVQCHTMGMYRQRHLIAQAIQKTCEGRLISIFDKSAESLPKMHGSELQNDWLWGERLVKTVASEDRCRYEVDWVTGQKTGFFVDQRENRALLAHYAKDKKVLNTFCYSGGFSIASLLAGAKEVYSVDSSQKALDLVDNNLKINGLLESNHFSIKADAVEYIKSIASDFDIIVLDPPAFAKHMGARHNAVQAYKRLNAHAFRQIKEGGLVFTFSCSQVVDKNLFRGAVTAAAIEVGRQVQVLHQLSQPADHPISAFHPEGEYLKGLVLRVL